MGKYIAMLLTIACTLSMTLTAYAGGDGSGPTPPQIAGTFYEEAEKAVVFSDDDITITIKNISDVMDVTFQFEVLNKSKKDLELRLLDTIAGEHVVGVEQQPEVLKAGALKNDYTYIRMSNSERAVGGTFSPQRMIPIVMDTYDNAYNKTGKIIQFMIIDSDKDVVSAGEKVFSNTNTAIYRIDDILYIV